jgi:type I restriction enzyme S subunit
MNVPKLRFKDDNGQDFPEWEKKTLKNVCIINPKSPKLPNKFIYIDLESVKNGLLLVENQVELELAPSRAQRLLQKNDILYQMVRPYQRNNLIFQKEGNYVASTGYAQLRTNQNAHYLFHFLHTDHFVDAVMLCCTGTSYPAIDTTSLSKMVVCLPSLHEQTKIANFLTSVDDKIAELTKKVALLQRYKKGAMQQIFSQQLRFKDENGQDFPEWEEKTLGEIANLKRGASPRPIADQKWFSDSSIIGWVRISDVSRSHKYLNHTEQYLSEEGISKSPFVKKGSIIMSICATIGKPIYTNFEVCIHDGFIVFEELQINPEFLYYYLLFIEKNWHQYGQPGSQVNLNTDIVSNEFIYIPVEKEQTKIANFLSALDEQINTTQQQLDLSKKYKKSLLQQMFI